MCGIAGVIYANRDRPVDRAMLASMIRTLVHRGPDGEGIHVEAGIGLGVRRLSIIDLETGDQPIASETGDVVVVCNGEIYNHVELRSELEARGHRFRSRSDVETIVHLYEESGAACVERLRGMFGLAVWDRPRRTLLLARDRFGIKPLYYAATGDGLLFASEQKALLASDCVGLDPCMRGFSDLLTKTFVVAPATLFADIRQLEPASVLVYRDGASSISTYWDARFEESPRRQPESRWVEAFREKLEETVRVHLRSDVPVGAWLSPGVDSSSIVALMSKHVSHRIHTATLSFEEPDVDEMRGRRTLLDDGPRDLASRVTTCGPADFERFVEAIWYAEDPTATGLEVPRLLLGEASARDVKVVLTGEGADEILAGYPYYRLDRIMRPLAWLPADVRRLVLLGETLPRRWRRASALWVAPRAIRMPRFLSSIGATNAGALQRSLSPELRSALAPDDAAWDLELPQGFDRWPALSQLQYYDLKVRLPSFVTHTLDRCAMAHSVEARVPFLDHELFELTAQMPPRLKLKGFREKHVLREAVRDLLPTEIVERRKRGLRAPVAQWFRDPLPDFATELLSEGALRRGGWFDPVGVAGLLREHRSGVWNRSAELMVVLAIQVWDALFVSRSLELGASVGRSPCAPSRG
jgi:asparagine synthase (glutamine-hydrolysing)